ncbi:MAG TPA: DUF2339 domain-containing protein [Candidatus Limnocylindrales bacterium]
MGTDDFRIDDLEERIDDLEQRMLKLELNRGGERVPPAVSAAAIAPPAPSPARPVAAAAPAPATPMVPPAAPPPTASPAAWQSATWRTSPEPSSPRAASSAPGTPVAPIHPGPSRRPVPARSPEAPLPAIGDGWGRAAPASATGPSLSLRDLEERFAGRALAWVGGLALVAAAVFFLSLAFSRGWINEPMRVGIGLAVGIAAFAGGAVMLARRNPLMGNVLSAVGLGIISIALFAATRLYGLVTPEVGLACALAAATAAAVIAIRFDAKEVAAFGLIAALIAPPVVGASPTTLTLLFVAVTLIGTTAIALFRTWPYLPPLAFILAAPQLASWLIGDPDPAQALVALAGFWVINIVAAAGEEGRIRRDDLRPSSATLVLANATFLLWGGYVVLVGDLEPWLGTFIALASLAHLLLGGWFLARQGLEHLFGNLVAGTGIALLAIAAFVQLGAPVVPLAWAAEAVALAWLAARRRHRWSALASLILGGLVITHLLVIEYPLWDFGLREVPTYAPPFLHPEAGSLVAVLAAIAVAIALVPVRWIRSALAATGILLAAYAVTFEMAGTALAAAIIGLALGGILLDRLVLRLPTDEDRLQPVAGWVWFGWFSTAAGAVAGLMAIALLFATEYPPSQLGETAATPFLHSETLSLAIVLAGLAAGGALIGVRWIRSTLAGVGILLAAWALVFEVTGPAFAGLMVLLLPIGVIIDRGLTRLPEEPRFARASDWAGEPTDSAVFATLAGAIAWSAAAVYALGRYLNPMDWGQVTPPAIPFSDERALVGALLALGALAAARWLVPMAFRRTAIMAAIVVAAWVVPFEVYADFVVILWVALAAVAVLLTRWDVRGLRPYTGLGALLTGGAALVVFAIVAPPYLLWVTDPAVVERVLLLAGWPLSFVALAAALYLAPRHAPFAPSRTWLEVAAGAVAVYAVSIGVVEVFQRMAGGEVAVEELAKQAQVALSVTWTLIGSCLLVVGLVRHHPMLRHAGFGLLGLATVKVFVIDLAAMDVAYRALVLAGLGVLLLASAFLFTHFRGPRSGAAGITGGPGPAV